MMRLHWSSPEVRAAADLALMVIDNILKNSNDSKFWSVNVRSEVSQLDVEYPFSSVFTFADGITFAHELLAPGICQEDMEPRLWEDVDEGVGLW